MSREPYTDTSTFHETHNRLTGSCYCGDITYEIVHSKTQKPSIITCHCPACRKTYGAECSVTVRVNSKWFRYMSGKLLMRQLVSPSGNTIVRETCETCGSLLLEYLACNPAAKSVSWGTLDAPALLEAPVYEFGTEFKEKVVYSTGKSKEERTKTRSAFILKKRIGAARSRPHSLTNDPAQCTPVQAVISPVSCKPESLPYCENPENVTTWI